MSHFFFHLTFSARSLWLKKSCICFNPIPWPLSIPCEIKLVVWGGQAHFVTTLTLDSRPKQRLVKLVGQEWNMGVTFHAPKSARECEGMNPHTPKWALTLGVGVSLDSRIFRGRLQGSNLIRLKKKLYYWKAFGT
jgi:hypothetical protein